MPGACGMGVTAGLPDNIESHGPLDVLVVSPHPDDAEISVSGTLLACRSRGLRVGILELTDGEPTPHGSRETRAAETAAASEILRPDFRGNLGLTNRSLQNDLESRRALAGVFRQLRPKVILAPYWDDAHPDHVAASQLCDAARFWAKLSRSDLAGSPYHPPRIYYFWSIHLRIHPRPSFVVDISPYIDRKMSAVKCYASQMIAGRSAEFPTILDDIRDRARYWGWTIGSGYAEPFASREEIGLAAPPDFL